MENKNFCLSKEIIKAQSRWQYLEHITKSSCPKYTKKFYYSIRKTQATSRKKGQDLKSRPYERRYLNGQRILKPQ